jgi:hypothetical protein
MDERITAAIDVLKHARDFPAKRFINPHIKNSIDKWASGEVPYLGDFLMAVMEDNLSDAIDHADRYNLITLPCIVQYVYMHVPIRARRTGARTWANYLKDHKEEIPMR